MEELKINVSTETADALHKAAEEAKLSIGEVVDRIMLTVAPDDPDIAWTLALEQYLICTARLSEEGSAKAFGNMCGLFLGSMPPEDLDDIISRVKSNQILEDYTPESITGEERDEFRKALTKILFSTRNAPVRKKFMPFSWIVLQLLLLAQGKNYDGVTKSHDRQPRLTRHFTSGQELGGTFVTEICSILPKVSFNCCSNRSAIGVNT